MKRLIVNADDLGITCGVNAAIVKAHQQGIVTSATLMANGAAFDDAVAAARINPGLAIGCHVVLLDGAPINRPASVPSLLRTEDELHSSITQFAPRALFGRFSRREVEAEAQAQFQKLAASGISISHFDSHKHAHMFPAVLGPVLSAARDAGIHAVRNPFEPSWALPFAVTSGSRKLALRSAEVALLSALRPTFMAAVRSAGLATPDGSIGVAATGSWSLGVLRKLIERLPEGTWELLCHPGYNDNDLAGIRTSLRAAREVELNLLTSPELRELLSRNGVELISYREFAAQT